MRHGIPVVFISSRHSQNVGALLNKVLLIYRRWNSRVPTTKLNQWLTEFKLHWPPPWKSGQKINMKYVVQTKSRPPTLVMFSNVFEPQLPENYVRQIMNQLRNEFSLQGCPIKLILRSTCLPNPKRKLDKKELMKWRKKGPQQERALRDLTKADRRRVNI